MQEESQRADYIASRRLALKRKVREFRVRAGISQEEVARFLACSRMRIIEIEKEDSPSEYSAAEIELLAALLGRNPLDILRMSGQEAIDVGRIMTEHRTGSVLQGLVDCELPEGIVQLFTEIDDVPGQLTFSPDGEMVASIVDDSLGEGGLEDDPPYPLTILCWEAHSGKLVSQLRLPDVEMIAPLHSGQVALLTFHPAPPHEQMIEREGAGELLMWDVRSGEIEQKFFLPEHVQAFAVSPDGQFFAVYFAATTTIQVWQVSDWTPVSAFELLFLADRHSPGDRLATAGEVRELSRERKYASHMLTFDSRRFDFLDNHTLTVGFDTGQVELDVRPATRGYVNRALLPFTYPSAPFTSLVHRRDERCEIACTKLEHDYHVGESHIEVYYLVPRKGEMHPWDSYVQIVRRFPGAVHRPVIIDDARMLSLVSYDTPYRRGWGYKSRVGLLNLVSGRVVMLMDGERLKGGDDQMEASLSPRGDAVAYWTQSHEGVLRLTVQFVDHAEFRLKGVSLSDELKLRRKIRMQEQEYAER
jgi:transcriptional regulator with XRE-family HTH domain